MALAPRSSVALACFALSHSALGCIAYEHTVDVEVHDPQRVSLENAGALETNGRTLVGRGGSMASLPTTMDRVELDGDVVRIPVCSRRHGCDRGVRRVTRIENVRLLRERDVPVWFVAVPELLLAGVAIAGSRAAWSPHTSGGPILLTAGIGLSILGIAQLFAPAKNERSLVPLTESP